MTNSHLRPVVAALTGLAALAPLSSAQTKLIEEGDPIPGLAGALCTRIDDVAVSNTGEWVLRIDTDLDSAIDEVVLKNGAVVFQQGTDTGLTGLPAGSLYRFLDRAFLTKDGNEIYLIDVELPGGVSSDVVYRNGTPILQQEVTLVNAVGVPANSLWASIAEIWVNGSNHILVGGRLDDGNDVIIKYTLDAAGAVLSEELIVTEGVTLPGHPTAIQGLSLSRFRNDINDAGEVLWFVDDDHTVMGGSTANDSWMYRDSMPLFREGDAMPSHPGSVYGTLSSVEVYLNNNGDYAAQVARDGSFTLDVIVINDDVNQIVAEEGQTVTAVPGGFTLTAIGSTSAPFLSDNGDVIWYGDWDDPDTDIDTGIFFNQEILFQEGVSTTINGDIIDTIATGDKTFTVSDNGDYLITEFFSITTGDPTFNGAYLYELDPNIGTPYCATVANSTGASGELVGIGSTAVSDNDLTLAASSLPNLAFAFVIVSETQGFNMNPGGSAGNICVAGDVGRVVGGTVSNTGTTGSFSVTADLTALPQPMGAVAVMPGDTWNFQVWHRDSVGGMATSNFSNGLAVSFN